MHRAEILARESREFTRNSMTEIIYKAESYAITGPCFEPGLLVNFGHYPTLEYERIAKTQHIKTKTTPPMSSSYHSRQFA
jgi:hypothetical protein